MAPIVPSSAPQILEWGVGYATRYAGWVLARLGFAVTSVGDAGPATWLDAGKRRIPGADVVSALERSDVCLVDASSDLGTVLSPSGPRPEALRALDVVDLGDLVTLADANAVIGARSGVGAAIGEADGPPLAPPGRMLEALVGLHAAAAALAAAIGSSGDGLGDTVSVDPVDSVAGIAAVNAVQYLNYGLRWRRAGATASGSGGPYPFRIFRAADGHVVLLARSRDEWEALLEMLGSPAWAESSRFADQLAIARDHADEVTSLIEAETARMTVADLVSRSRDARVPLAPVRDLDAVLADRRLVEAGPSGPRLVSPVDVVARRPAARRQGRHRVTAGPPAPLDGLRVLDLGWVWAAPIAASWLADLGADVVKVESRGRLDVARRRGVEFPAGSGPADHLPPYERALVFDAANRNKRSIELDLKDGPGRQTFLELVRRADVVVESFSGGVLERLDLTPKRLIEHNPELLVLSLGGASGDEEFVARSYAPILSALAGIEGAVRARDGSPIGMMNWGGADASGGSWGMLAVLAALAQGRAGTHLKVSQLRGIVNTCAALYFEGAGAEPIGGDAAEVTPDHVSGVATDPLGDVYRNVTVRSWDPRTGERVSFAPPWRFRRRPVEVRCGAPLLGSTDPGDLLEQWSRAPVSDSDG